MGICVPRMDFACPHCPVFTHMIITPCPRCGESVRLPGQQLADETTLTCPWCRESYSMAEVNLALPPLLIVAGIESLQTDSEEITGENDRLNELVFDFDANGGLVLSP